MLVGGDCPRKCCEYCCNWCNCKLFKRILREWASMKMINVIGRVVAMNFWRGEVKGVLGGVFVNSINANMIKGNIMAAFNVTEIIVVNVGAKSVSKVQG